MSLVDRVLVGIAFLLLTAGLTFLVIAAMRPNNQLSFSEWNAKMKAECTLLGVSSVSQAHPHQHEVYNCPEGQGERE